MAGSWFPPGATLDQIVKGRGPYRVADVLGAAGGLALGAVQAGFELAAKREDAYAAGVGLMTANRALLGQRWSVQAVTPDRWRRVTADVVVSAARDEVEALITYTALLKPAVLVLDTLPGVCEPEGLARSLSARSRLRYLPTRVRYNDLSLGGALDRVRVFTLLSQIPVGVDRVALDWLPSADDAVMDLLDLEETWESQDLVRSPTWYTRALRSPEHAVDGFAPAVGYRTMREWDWKRPGQVLSTGAVIPVRGRDRHPLTHREIARLMAFPDAWRLGTAPRGEGGRYLGAYWEETTSPRSAAWVLGWVHASLDGAPGPLRGEVDVSGDWRPLAARRWPEEAA